MKYMKSSNNHNIISSLPNRILYILFFIITASVFFPWHVYVKFFFCIYALILIKNRVSFDSMALWLLIFSVSYSLFGLLNHHFTLLFFSYIIAPFTYYLLGKYVIKDLSLNNVIWFVILTILSLGLYVYIGAIIQMKAGILVSVTRKIDLPYIDEMAATLLGAVVSLGFCGLPMFLKYGNLKNIQSWLFLLLFFFSLLVILHLSNRTGMVVILVCLVFSFFYRVKRISRLAMIIITFITVFVLIELWQKYGILFDDFVSSFETRNDNSSIETGGDRTTRWIDAIGNLFTSPLGWDPTYGRVHNYWLDVARVGGIIPFIALIVATIKSIIVSLKMFNIKHSLFIFLLLELYICFFLTCMVEPILEGISTYTYLFCMLWGMQKQFCLSYLLFKKKRAVLQNHAS